MPWVAWLTLVGALAIAGLPPLNGFVSEWLLLQAFLFADDGAAHLRQHAAAGRCRGRRAVHGARRLRDGEVLRRDLPRASRARPRSRRRTTPACSSALGLLWLALGCVALGLLPVQVIARARHREPRPAGLPRSPLRPRTGGCWCRAAARGASYGPLVFLRGVDALVIVLAMLGGAHLLPPARAPRASLGLRLRAARRAHAGHRRGLRSADPAHLPALLPDARATLPTPFDRAPRYRVTVGDRIWR